MLFVALPPRLDDLHIGEIDTVTLTGLLNRALLCKGTSGLIGHLESVF